MVATEGRDRCDFKLDRPVPHDQNKILRFDAKQKHIYNHQVPFMSGRIDCQPDPAKKWTPFDFEATEVERQSNPRGTGNQVEHLRI